MHVSEDMINPELRLPNWFFKALYTPNLTEEQIRARKPSAVLRVMNHLKPAGLDIREGELTRPDGSKMEILRITRKDTSGANRPGILNIHGGGYSEGSPEQDIIQAKIILGLTDAVFITPAYRLSIEAPYPAAVDDCYLTLKWMRDHAAELGIRDDQLIVMGGSAGGGLTAATTLMARQKGEVNIAFQMPLCPMIDDRETPSHTDNNAPIYDGPTNDANWRIYLGDLYGTDDVPPTAAPARETDYAGLPPTITMVGTIEPFYDETVAYVEHLCEAGVPVAFREFEGAWHGFEGIAAWTKIAKQANTWRDAQFFAFLEKYFAPQDESVPRDAETNRVDDVFKATETAISSTGGSTAQKAATAAGVAAAVAAVAVIAKRGREPSSPSNQQRRTTMIEKTTYNPKKLGSFESLVFTRNRDAT